MIDYKRVERDAKGIDKAASKPEPEPTPEVELSRCRKLVEVQKTLIKRLQRLLGVNLTFVKRP